MTSVLAEAVRELADALDQPFEVEAEDTGIGGGATYAVLSSGGPPVIVEGTTLPCWFVRLGVDQHEFKDHIAAMIYLRVLGVRDET